MQSALHWLPALGLCMIRPLGMMLLLPLFQAKSLGGSLIRNTLILLIALPVLPIMEPMGHDISQMSGWGLLTLCTKELVIGLLLGFSAAIPFWAIDMAGFIIDTMRGASMSTILNPLMGLQSSVFGTLFTQVLTVLFLVAGGFNYLLTALYHSYQQLPPGETLNFTSSIVEFFKGEWQLMYDLAIRFALPSMVVMVLIDMAMGIINRSAQQLNVFFLSMPIKSIFVLLLLLYSLNSSFSYYLNRINSSEQQLGQLIHHLLPDQS